MTYRRLSAALLLGIVALVALAAEAQTPAAAAKPPEPSQVAVLAENTVFRGNVAYGSDDKQRLDVYSPRGAVGVPVVVFIHGGEWTRHDKADVSYKPKFLNQNGIVLVSVNYCLSPAVTHPAHVRDVAAAVRWVSDHAAEIGASAQDRRHGPLGRLPSRDPLALDPRYLAAVGLRPADLGGVVAWSGGAYDLVEKVKAGGMYPPYIRTAFGDSPAAWRDASPVAHVGDARPLPPFLFVSVERGNPSHQAAERLAGLIRDAKGKAESLVIEGRSHFMANHLLGRLTTRPGAMLLEFVRKVTRDR